MTEPCPDGPSRQGRTAAHRDPAAPAHPGDGRRPRSPAPLKLFVDRAAAGAALLVLSPLVAAIALVLRVVAGPPVLFRQVRAGLHGRPFVILKFRTMDMQGARCCRSPDPCVGLRPEQVQLLPLTTWLRRTGLDELPQLWNVLRGDMSFVGPRPLMLRYSPRFSPRQGRRLEVRPGITGWAQTHGRTSLPWPQRLEMDVWYVENRTARLDLRIALRTVLMALSGSRYGAADDGPGHEFLGTGVPGGVCPASGEPLVPE